MLTGYLEGLLVYPQTMSQTLPIEVTASLGLRDLGMLPAQIIGEQGLSCVTIPQFRPKGYVGRSHRASVHRRRTG